MSVGHGRSGTRCVIHKKLSIDNAPPSMTERLTIDTAKLLIIGDTANFYGNKIARTHEKAHNSGGWVAHHALGKTPHTLLKVAGFVAVERITRQEKIGIA